MDIREALRSIIWGIMSCFLHVIDCLWQVSKLICGMDFNDSSFNFVWDWFKYIIVFFVLFLVFRVAKIIISAFLDEDIMNKLDPGKFIMKIAISIFIMSAVPFATKQLTGMVGNFVNHIEYFTGDYQLQNTGKLSTLLVDTSSLNLESGDANSTVKTMKNYILEQKKETEDATYLSEKEFRKSLKSMTADSVSAYLPGVNVPGSQLSESQIKQAYKAYMKAAKKNVDDTYNKTYWVTGNISNIDINEGTESGSLFDYFTNTVTFGLAGTVDKVYYMYPSWSSLFFGLFTVIGVSLLFIPIILQMAMRFVSLITKIFLAPYAVASMIEPENKTFSTWVKYVLADLINNFFQLYSIMLLFAVIGSSSLDNMLKTTTVAGAVAKIAIILGGLMAIYATPAGVAAIIGGADMSAANTMQQIQSLMMVGRMTSATALSGAGAAMGAIGATIGAGGRLSGKIGSGLNAINSKFGNGAGSGNVDGFGSSTGGSPLNELSPNKAQMDYAKSLGIDPSGMNRGSLASAVAEAGGSPSAFSAMGNDIPLTGGQMDYASSLGIDASDMAQSDLSSALSDAGGSQTAMGLLGKDNGMSPSIGQVHYAQTLGIENAQAMSRSQLGQAVANAGGSTIRFNRAGGMTTQEAINVSRASSMNTKNASGNYISRASSVGNFFTSKAASLQSMANKSMYGMYGRGR